MFDILKYIKDSLQEKNFDKNGHKKKRSSKWSKVRNKHIKENPCCAVCGLKTKLECHHKVPFSIDSSLELNPNNLITLCDNKKYGLNCHQLIGHRGAYRKFNPSVDVDVATWKIKLGVFKKNSK